MALNVWLAGGKAVRWSHSSDVSLEEVDGVIIGGGDDIAPTLYGGEVRVGVRLDHDRDSMEQTALRGAFERGLPILGICRGSQMLNVVLGGNLHQDAYRTYGSTYYRTVLARKRVQVKEGTLLFNVLDTQELEVNALHSQAVDRLGEGLRIAAVDDGGMVQAVERATDPFALGVQWHPEYLFYRRAHRKLFGALVAAATAARADRGQIGAVRRDSAAD
ncbi:Putative glutamine amidotransferase [Planctomycetes bacterium Poly30]|uniref:Glutamine amidotransferase n=2 Tax=Saltatorellus ferox TaxID=2528018 RepID=A0A518EZ33_9BACT|nr:Putative glutamine amidotransferase [Planctomycetes bacterium Poly30]